MDMNLLNVLKKKTRTARFRNEIFQRRWNQEYYKKETSTVVWPCKIMDRIRTMRSISELKYKRRRSIGQPRTRCFSWILEHINKSGNRCHEIERKRKITDFSFINPYKMETMLEEVEEEEDIWLCQLYSLFFSFMPSSIF
jgi:hypothetical protein